MELSCPGGTLLSVGNYLIRVELFFQVELVFFVCVFVVPGGALISWWNSDFQVESDFRVEILYPGGTLIFGWNSCICCATAPGLWPADAL